ncbi:YadA C-terminal domain-containing protein [Shewanella woodyi]|uniref:YadA C-terminal domain-containing protein n=1 Tax=Shewanella woodyi TaxID=60961 RepID=UPI003748FE31
MKKSIIALSVVTVMSSSGALAASAEFEYDTVDGVKNHIAKLAKEGADVNYNDHAVVIEKDGKRITITKDGDNYAVRDGKDVHTVETNDRGQIVKVNGAHAHKNVRIKEGKVLKATIDGRVSDNENGIRNNKVDVAANAVAIKNSAADIEQMIDINEIQSDAINENAAAIGSNSVKVKRNAKSIEVIDRRSEIIEARLGSTEEYDRIYKKTGGENVYQAIVNNRDDGTEAYTDLDKRIDEVASKGYDDSQLREDGQEYVSTRLNAATSELAKNGQTYVDGQLARVESRGAEFAKEARTDAEAAYAKLDKRIKDGNNNGGSISDADIEAANKAVDAKIAEATKVDEAKIRDEVSKVADKKIDDAIASVDTAAVEKAVEDKVNDVISKIDTKSVQDEVAKFIASLEKDAHAISRAGAAESARLDGRIDENSKQIKINTDRIDALEDQIVGFKDHMNNNAAMTNALSGLPQPYGVGKIQVGVGLGFANDAKAVAVGMGYRVNEALVIRAGVSKSAGNSGDVQGNVAVGYEF